MLGVLLAIVLGGVASEYRAYLATNEKRRAITAIAADYATDLANLSHDLLATSTPLDAPQSRRVVRAMRAWLAMNPEVADLATYRRADDGGWIRVANPSLGDRKATDSSLPAKLVGFDRLMDEAWTAKAAFSEQPIMQERGRYVRAFYPIHDESGKVEAVLVMNVPTAVFESTRIWAYPLGYARVYLGYLFITAAIYISRRQTKLAERILANEKVAESELRFRSLFENLPNIAVQGVDRERRIIFWNGACAKLLGYTAQETIGQKIESLGFVEPKLENVLSGAGNADQPEKRNAATELKLRCKDGGGISVLASHLTLANARGEPETYWVLVDLTDRNRTHEALEASMRDYRALFETMPLAMWVHCGTTDRLLEANGAALQQYGYSRAEFLELGLPEVEVAEGGTGGALRRRASHPREFATAQERLHQRKNGETIRVEVVSHKLSWVGQPVYLIVAQDLTERRNADRRIREQAALLDKTNEAIVVLDMEDRVSFWNRGATKLFGLAAASVQGRPLAELAKSMPTLQTLWKVFRMHPGSCHCETGPLPGQTLVLETSITVVCDDQGNPAARLSVSSDITERKALESQIIEAQKMEVIGQLAGGVAHDFNSILMAMTLNLEMLASDLQANPAVLPMIEEQKNMTERATRLVRQLLLFGRKHTMATQPLELHAATTAVTKIMRRLLGANIKLALEGDGSTLWIDADPGMIDQVVLNLAVNARDAMPHGGKLTIKVQKAEVGPAVVRQHPQARVGTFACLGVSDTGCGMPPDILARVFEPFFTTKGIGEGTGLGLSTVHGIAHQHNGWVMAESVVGEGSTFCVFLPLIPAPPDEATIPAPNTVSKGSETILLVEDDDAVRRVIAATLSQHGYRLFACNSAAQALKIWTDRSDIDLLLTDVMLPGDMSGFELTQHLRAKDPLLRVVIISGYNIEAIKPEDVSTAGVKYVQKPINAVKLATVIRNCLD